MTKRRTERVNASEARRRFSELVNEVFGGDSRVLVEKSGIPVAAIVSAVDLRRLEYWDSKEEMLFEELRAASPGLPDDELMAEVGKVIEQVRAERRQAPTRRAS